MCDLSLTGWPQIFTAWREISSLEFLIPSFPDKVSMIRQKLEQSSGKVKRLTTGTGCNHLTILIMMMTKIMTMAMMMTTIANTMRMLITITLNVCLPLCMHNVNMSDSAQT